MSLAMLALCGLCATIASVAVMLPATRDVKSRDATRQYDYYPPEYDYDRPRNCELVFPARMP
jgi:hypothetical protein